MTATSQLYSHWKTMHAGNQSAEQLTARWRFAIKNKGASKEDICNRCPVTWSGPAEEGYVPLRAAPMDAAHFPHNFTAGVPRVRWQHTEGTE